MQPFMSDQALPPNEDPSTSRPLGRTGTRWLVIGLFLLAVATAVGSAYMLVSTAESALDEEEAAPDTTQVEERPDPRSGDLDD